MEDQRNVMIGIQNDAIVYVPFTSKSLYIAERVTARIAAFIPGASPPDVRIPTHLIVAIESKFFY
jgi:hypothetical protein